MRPFIVVFLLGWLSVMPAFGATPASYEVEVLVFETRLPELEGSELWTRVPPPNLTEVATPAEASPTEDFAAFAEALRGDNRFRVLLHRRWLQNPEPRSNATPVQLLTWDEELGGTLTFYLSRFLHVELNLLFQPLLGAIGGDYAPSYLISEERRIRSNELHYFDHPKFGVLLRVSPVKG